MENIKVNEVTYPVLLQTTLESYQLLKETGRLRESSNPDKSRVVCITGADIEDTYTVKKFMELNYYFELLQDIEDRYSEEGFIPNLQQSLLAMRSVFEDSDVPTFKYDNRTGTYIFEDIVLDVMAPAFGCFNLSYKVDSKTTALDTYVQAIEAYIGITSLEMPKWYDSAMLTVRRYAEKLKKKDALYISIESLEKDEASFDIICEYIGRALTIDEFNWLINEYPQELTQLCFAYKAIGAWKCAKTPEELTLAIIKHNSELESAATSPIMETVEDAEKPIIDLLQRYMGISDVEAVNVLKTAPERIIMETLIEFTNTKRFNVDALMPYTTNDIDAVALTYYKDCLRDASAEDRRIMLQVLESRNANLAVNLPSWFERLMEDVQSDRQVTELCEFIRQLR